MDWILILLVIIFIILIAICVMKSMKGIFRNFIGGYAPVFITDARKSLPVPYNDDITNKTSQFIPRKKYIDGQSDTQIKYIFENGNPKEVARLYEIMSRIKKIKNMGFLTNKDSEIYMEIQPKNDPKNDHNHRADFHSETLFRILKDNSIELDKPAYLDIGCMDGSITKSLGDRIGAREIHCVEPEPKNKTSGVIFTTEVNKYPFEDNKFDLITALMTLHHIPVVDSAIKEIIRVLKPGGWLLIKEHDCWNPIDCMLVDIEHCVHMILSGELKPGQLLPADYFIAYRNHDEYNRLFSDGLELVDWNYYYNQIRNEITPTRAYYAIYRKKL